MNRKSRQQCHQLIGKLITADLNSAFFVAYRSIDWFYFKSMTQSEWNVRSKSNNHYGSLFFADYPHTLPPPLCTQLGAISPRSICISEVMRFGGRPSTTSIRIHVGGCSVSWRRVGARWSMRGENMVSLVLRRYDSVMRSSATNH